MITLTLETHEVDTLIHNLETVEEAMADGIKQKKALLMTAQFILNMKLMTEPDHKMSELEQKAKEAFPEMEKAIQKYEKELQDLKLLLNKISPERELEFLNKE